MGGAADRDKLLFKVATAYYRDDETQQAIADRFGVSRVKVCRLLKQAREEGVVTIGIRSPAGEAGDLERRLEDRYGLREAIVADGGDGGDGVDAASAAGAAAAAYFRRIARDGLTVALSWGNALLSFVNALDGLDDHGIRAVQLLGGLGDADADVHGAELTRRLAQRLGTKPRLLQSPGIVASRELRAALVSDQQIAETLELARRSDVAFLGIGVLDGASLLRGGSIIDGAELDRLAAAGAVGDLALNFFDASGAPVPSSADGRVVGLSLDEIRAIPRTVAVAWGRRKAAALRGALLGRLVTVLVTDAEAAAALLE
jgi:DNA-binding transcriptional regulator LsrR (DeoR family)